MAKALRLGLSPCPNDTFIFHALLENEIDPRLPDGTRFAPVFADVERLNNMAIKGEAPVTKVSLGVVPKIIDKYKILNAGSALGWGCGPVLLAREEVRPEDLGEAVLAIPGANTTANRLLDVHGGFPGPRREYVFDQIMPAIVRGEVAAGVVIHEGRFTYQNYGLKKILDLGEFWENRYHIPLPLGAIVVRRDIPADLAAAIDSAIRRSIEFAWQNPERSRKFIKDRAQEMAAPVIDAHISTFVTRYSADLGEDGKAAIRTLLKLDDLDLFRV